MRRFIGLTGQKFDRLVVIKQVGKSKTGGPLWLCRCVCGKETIVRSSNLKNGHTKSCGCLQKEIVTKHGYNKKGAKTRIYSIWEHIIQRCRNKNHKAYKNYGGRGIKVCNRWLDFKNFLKDVGEIPKGMEIDRINNDKGYSPKNFRLVTHQENNRNKRNNHIIPYNNKKYCLIELAEEYNINPHVLRSRLKLGWPIKKALITPVKKYKRRK
jgi:hypothetical protein